MGPACPRETGGWGSASVRTLDTRPPYRSQRRVADLVEGVVEQGERRTEHGNAGTRRDRPHRLAGLQRCVVLRPVQHRAQPTVLGSPRPMNWRLEENSTAYRALVRKHATSSEVMVGMTSTAMM